MARHALASSLHIARRVVEPELLRIFGAEPGGDVAQRVVRRGLVGDYVRIEPPSRERRQNLGRVAVQADRKGPLRALGLDREAQRVLQVVGTNVEGAVLDATVEGVRVRFNTEGASTVA